MHKKNISIALAFLGATVAIGCGATVAFAQEGGMPPSPSSSGGSGFTSPSSEPMIQPAPRMEPVPMMDGGGGNMPPPPERPNVGLPSDGRMAPFSPRGDFRQEQKPYPASEAEVRARVTEDMTRKITEQMTEKIRSRYEGQRHPSSGEMMQNQQGRTASPERQRGEPFEGERFMPPSQGKGQPFMGGGDFRPPSQGSGQPFEDGGFGPPGNFGPGGGGREFGPSGFGGSWGPGGDGEGGGFSGPSEEEMGQMMEEREKQMKMQQLAQMRRGFGGMESGLRQVKKVIDRLIKKGVAVPQEYVSLVDDLTRAVEVVKNAEDFDETVEAAMEVLQEKGPELGDIGPRLGMLEQWPKVLSQAEKQVKRLESVLAKTKKRKGTAEYADIVAKVEARVGGIRSRYEEIRRAGESGDFEEAMDSMQEFFEDIGDAHREVGVLDQLGNIAKMIRSGEKEIASFEKQVKRLEKRGINASSVTALIAEGRAKLAELKALGKNADAEPEDFFAIMQELDELRQRATDEFNLLQGRGASQEGAVIRSLIELREGR